MTDAVHAVLLRLERPEGVQEVGHAEAVRLPAREVAGQGGEIGGVVREERGQRGDGGGDHGDVVAGGGVVDGVRHRAVLGLESLECRGGRLEPQPGRMGLGVAGVLDDLRLADDGLLRGQRSGHERLLSLCRR